MDETTQNFIEEQNAELIKVVKAGFDEVDKRFDGVDKRFEGVDKRFESVDKRFDSLEDNLEDFKTETAQNFQDVRRDIAELKKISIPLDEYQEMLRRITRLEQQVEVKN